MKKSIVVSIVISVLAISQVAFANFTDVSGEFHLYKSINWLESQGVVEGYEDGTFKPDAKVNRAEFLKMLYETIGMEGSDVELSFPDVPENEWYTKYVKEAYQTGVVVGYDDGYFHPEGMINMAEALKIVTLAFFDVDSLYGDGLVYDVAYPLDVLPSVDVNGWYWKYIHVADELFILHFESSANVWTFADGLDVLTDFDPATYITRADMAALLYRAKTIKDNDLETYNSYLSPNDVLGSTLTSEQYSAQVICLELSGSDYIAFSELYGVDQLFCTFDNGECTQTELNDGVCYMQS